MREARIEKNMVTVIGEVVSGFTFSHRVYGEGFYMVNLSVNRLSAQMDIIPLMVSERLVDITKNYSGCIIEAIGQFRSRNHHEGGKNHMILSVFVREFCFINNFTDSNTTNHIYLDGFICKPVIYRKTPLDREIADILLAVNRSFGKTDYLPCIAWGRNARFATEFEVGFHLEIEGRIQSREYKKNISESKSETRIAYEVSVSRVEVIADEKA